MDHHRGINIFVGITTTIRFDKVNGFIRLYDGTRYLVLLSSEEHNVIYNKISQKSSITYVIFRNFAKIKVDLYDSLNLEKTLTLHYCIILIKSVFNKYQITFTIIHF